VRVQVFDWRQWREIVTDINAYAPFDRYRQIVGYSIGANAADWVLCGLNYQRAVRQDPRLPSRYAVFIDRRLSPLSPLTSKTLKRAHWYCNRSIDLVGHAAMSLDADSTTRTSDHHHLQQPSDPRLRSGHPARCAT
jgi:hypothetical protein